MGYNIVATHKIKSRGHQLWLLAHFPNDVTYKIDQHSKTPPTKWSCGRPHVPICFNVCIHMYVLYYICIYIYIYHQLFLPIISQYVCWIYAFQRRMDSFTAASVAHRVLRPYLHSNAELMTLGHQPMRRKYRGVEFSCKKKWEVRMGKNVSLLFVAARSEGIDWDCRVSSVPFLLVCNIYIYVCVCVKYTYIIYNHNLLYIYICIHT